MKTIGRNRKKRVMEIFENAKNIIVYALDYNFKGTPANKNVLVEKWTALSFAKLRDHGDGKFSLKVHSNLWYEFEI